MSDDLWDSQAPLSNDQFRQLLDTPLHKRKATFLARRPKKRTAEQEEGKEAKEEAQWDPLPVVSELAYNIPASDKPAYRDRAKERREGRNFDYEEANEDVDATSTDGKKWLSVDETKFLGGDLEHTHLVKGLDYALLKKERARLAKTEEESVKKEERKRQHNQRTKVKHSTHQNVLLKVR